MQEKAKFDNKKKHLTLCGRLKTPIVDLCYALNVSCKIKATYMLSGKTS
jgi:hypothetical protein